MSIKMMKYKSNKWQTWKGIKQTNKKYPFQSKSPGIKLLSKHSIVHCVIFYGRINWIINNNSILKLIIHACGKIFKLLQGVVPIKFTQCFIF